MAGKHIADANEATINALKERLGSISASELFDVTVSKNLCEENFIDGYGLNVVTGNIESALGANSFAVIIPIEADKTYTITKFVGGNRFRLGLTTIYPSFDLLPISPVYSYFGPSGSAQQSHTFTNTYGATYAVLVVTSSNTVLPNVQLEEGDTATSYVPYSSTTYIKNELIDTAALGVTTSNFIDVKTYGALGDGITDDTAVLEEVFEDAFVAKKAVYFPSGTYMIRRPLTLKSGMEIYGSNATIKKFAAVTATTTLETPELQEYVTVDSVTGFVVGSAMYITAYSSANLGARHCTYGTITSIDTTNNRIYFKSSYDSIKKGAAKTHSVGCKVSTSHALLRSWGTYFECVGAYIHNLTLDGNSQSTEPAEWANSCIHIDANTGTFNGIPYDKAASDNIFKNLIIKNSPCDSISDQCTGGAIIDGCISINSKNHGVHFGTFYVNGKVINSTITTAGAAGVFWCQSVDNVVVSNNFIEGCNKGVSSVEFSTPASNSVITSNIFKNIVNTVCDFVADASGYGGLIISNNLVIGLKSEFVKCADMNDVSITGNIIRTITTAPAYIVNGTNVDGLLITGNLSPTNSDYVLSTSSNRVINANNSWN